MTDQLTLLPHEIAVDLFAGGGGASCGIARGLGRSVDIAVNHDPDAVAMHQANHPGTRHYCESVFKVSCEHVTERQPVGLLWASPDCTHHSKAKGGKPVSSKRRGLAWAVVKWARRCRFESPDGAFEFQIHALSEDHARILLDDLRNTATVLGRIEREGPLQ